MVCVMTPGFYMGVAPVKEAEASLESIFSGTVGAMAACYLPQLWSFIVGTVKDIAFTLDSVPTHESKPSTVDNIKASGDGASANVFKECILDALAWAAKNLVYEYVLKNIVNWINKGFDNGPAFLSDPDSFFRQLTFAALDGFIEESGLDAYLCEPFKDTIMNHMRSIKLTASFKKYKCSLQDLANGGGIAGYKKMVLEGNLDFKGGGFAGAMALARAGNNGYSAIFNVENEAREKINNVVNTESALLTMGDGFFSLRCDMNNDGVKEVCTPGNFVGKQINNWMNGGLDQLMSADEVSEIVAAIVSTLVQKVLFDGEKGLLADLEKTNDGEWDSYKYNGPVVENGGQGEVDGQEGSYQFVDGEWKFVPNEPEEQQLGVWVNPETKEVWTKTNEGTFINSNGKEVDIGSDGVARDTKTNEPVSLGTVSSTVDGVTKSVDVAATLSAMENALGYVSFEDVAVTAASMLGGYVGLAALGYGYVTDTGIISSLIEGYTDESKIQAALAEVQARIDARESGVVSGWDNPDTPDIDESNALGLTSEQSETQTAQVGTDSSGDIGGESAMGDPGGRSQGDPDGDAGTDPN